MSKRNEYVELGRLIAAILIVWLHTVGAVGYLPLEGSTRWARWAVPFFIAASLWFVNPASESLRPWLYFKARFLRLYPVFIVWNLFYLGIRLISGVFIQSSLKLDWVSFLRQFFIDGFAHHLWFLTFLLLVEVSITVFALIRPSIWFSVPVATFCLCILCILPTSIYPTFGSYLMVMSWWSLPAVFLVVLFRPAFRYIIDRDRYLSGYAAGFIIIGLLITWVATFAARNSVLEAASGVFLFFGFLLLGLCNKRDLPTSLRSLATLSAGIYLTHVFYVEALGHISSQFKLPVRSYEGVILIFVFSLIATIISVVLLKQIGPKWIFNGFPGSYKKG